MHACVCVCVRVSVQVSNILIQINMRLDIVFGGGGGWGSLQGDHVRDKFRSRGVTPLPSRGGHCGGGSHEVFSIIVIATIHAVLS